MKTPTMRSIALGTLAIGFAAFATSCMDPHHDHRGDRDHRHTGHPGYNPQQTTHKESSHHHSGNQQQKGKVPGTKPGSENYTNSRN